MDHQRRVGRRPLRLRSRRAAAALADVRLHDLRDSFAIADGASLYFVAKALGHADARTTERYAHLSDNPLRNSPRLQAGGCQASPMVERWRELEEAERSARVQARP